MAVCPLSEFIYALRSDSIMKKSSLILVVAAAIIAISLRLIEGPMHNFSAMGALAVLCGVVVRPVWLGLLIPLSCRALTDCVLEYRTGYGFYDSILFDYAAYAMIFGIGRLLQPRQMMPAFGAGLLAALTFFLVSNVGVWLLPHEGQYLYTRSWQGLLECFSMAVPFARGTFIGDIGFTSVFVGILHFLALPVLGNDAGKLQSFPRSTIDGN